MFIIKTLIVEMTGNFISRHNLKQRLKTHCQNWVLSLRGKNFDLILICSGLISKLYLHNLKVGFISNHLIPETSIYLVSS